MIEVRILGPVDVVGPGGPHSVGGKRERTLLGLLCARLDEGLSPGELLSELWGGDPPDGAIVTLRSYVSRLRRVLKADDDRRVIVSTGGRYRLDPHSIIVDSQRFEMTLAAVPAQDASAPSVRSSALSQALSIWRGDPYGECNKSAIIESDSIRLDELRLIALDDRIEADLQSGRHRHLVAELQDLVAANPVRESFCRSLVLALYRSGRRVEALRSAHEYRSRLRVGSGLRPSAAMEALEHAVLVDEPGLEWNEARDEVRIPDLQPLHRVPREERLAPAARTGSAALSEGWRLLREGQAAAAEQCFADAIPAQRDADSPDLSRLRADLLFGVAQARLQRRQVEGTKSAALSAAHSAREIGDSVRLAQAAIVASFLNSVGHSDEAVVALCDEAVDALQGSHPALAARVLAGRADHEAFAQGDGERAIETSARALELAERSDDEIALGRCLFVHAETLGWTPRVSERGLLSERLIDLGRRIGDSSAESEGLHVRALARLTVGDIEGFDRDRARMENLAAEHGAWYPGVFVVLWRGMRAIMKGRFQEAEATVAELYGTASHEPNVQNLCAGQLFFLRLEQGRALELRPLIAQQVSQEPQITAFRAAYSLLLSRCGDRDEAIDVLSSVVTDGGIAAPHDLNWLTTACLAAETAADCNDARRAGAVLEALYPYRGLVGVLSEGVTCAGAMDRYLARLSAVIGDEEQARSFFESALVRNESLDSGPLAARTKLHFGEYLLRNNEPGDIDLGRRYAADAAKIGAGLGMTDLCSAAKSLVENSSG